MRPLQLQVHLRANVIPTAPVVTSVVATPASFGLTVGGTQQLVVKAYDKDTNEIVGRTMVCTSSNAAVATISATALVTGVAAGDANFTITVDGVPANSVTVAHVVVEPVTQVTLDQATMALVEGQSAILTATPRASNGAALPGKTVTWNSSDTGKATMGADVTTDDPDHHSTVTAVLAGTSNLKATCSGIDSSFCALTVTAVPVTPVATTVTMNFATASGNPGGSLGLIATVFDQFGAAMTGQTVAWSSNSASATVSAASSVTPAGVTADYVSNGTPVITATCNGHSATCTITITTAAPSTLTLNATSAPGLVNGFTTLTATARDSGGNIVSSAATVWSVDNAHATATTPGASSTIQFVSTGTSVVTATLGALTATCTFTITASSGAVRPEYDPLRLGAELLWGTALVNPTFSTDQGRNWYRTTIANVGNSSGGSLLDTQWGIEPDVTGIWPNVMRNQFLRGNAFSTLSIQKDPLNVSNRWWRRVVFRFVSPNTYNGSGVNTPASVYAPSGGGAPPVPHTGFFTTYTQTPGESGTLKFFFSWRGAAPRGRFGLNWVPSGYLSPEIGHNDLLNNTVSNTATSQYREHQVVYTELVQTQSLATNPQSVATGNNIGIYVATRPFQVLANRAASSATDNYSPAHNTYPSQPYQYRAKVIAAMDAPNAQIVTDCSATGKYATHGHIFNNQDWYELIANYERLSGTNDVQGGSYIQRVFLRRLTVDGIWDPWPGPVWWGIKATNAVPLAYNGFWHTGNRSGGWPTSTTVGSNGDAIEYEGPAEITSAADPYNWAGYGV